MKISAECKRIHILGKQLKFSILATLLNQCQSYEQILTGRPHFGRAVGKQT